MDLEKAIKTAIQFETRVRDVYLEAVGKSHSEPGRKIYNQLAGEEQSHLDYLNSRLNEWRKTGKITPARLETTVPSKKTIEQGVGKLKGHLKEPDAYGELQMLTKALDVEIETSNFYQEMVNSLEGDAQKMFNRFLEIEAGHLALVQAEIDALTGMGVWFDTIEFDLEGT